MKILKVLLLSALPAIGLFSCQKHNGNDDPSTFTKLSTTSKTTILNQTKLNYCKG